MGPVRQVTEPPWASVSHIGVHATNWEYSLDFIEARNNNLHHIGAIMQFGAGFHSWF